MSKFKVKTNAVINHNPVGSTIELPKADADRLSHIGYVDIIEEVKPKPAKKKTATKTATKKK